MVTIKPQRNKLYEKLTEIVEHNKTMKIIGVNKRQEVKIEKKMYL